MLKPHFIVDPDSLQLLKDDVGVGHIRELSPSDASLVAPHLGRHPDTVYIATSGVPVGNDYGAFAYGQTLLAVEWVRQETRPQIGEPECNNYRYVFGVSKSGSCIGLEVTRKFSNSETDQVGNHWDDFDGLYSRHFGNNLEGIDS